MYSVAMVITENMREASLQQRFDARDGFFSFATIRQQTPATLAIYSSVYERKRERDNICIHKQNINEKKKEERRKGRFTLNDTT
jgi:hypothetical protein